MDLPVDFKELLEEFDREKVEVVRGAGRPQDLLDVEFLERVRAAKK